MNIGYASKSTAVRGAKRAGIENPQVEQKEDGKWYVVQPTLEPGVYDATITKAKVRKDGSVETTIKIDSDPAIIVKDVIKPQPELSPETAALAEKTIETAKEDLAKLAATLPPRVVSTPEEIAARRAERRDRIDAEKANAPVKEKIPSYKELHRSSPQKSAIMKPVDVIRAFLDEHYDTMSRKEAIAHLVAKGINMTTCRTQYQIYRKKRLGGAA